MNVITMVVLSSHIEPRRCDIFCHEVSVEMLVIFDGIPTSESYLVKEVKPTVVTVHDDFHDGQRQCTKSAGIIAVVNVT